MYDDLKARMESTLRLARRADATRTEYLRSVGSFLEFTGSKPESELCEADARAWLHHLLDERKVAAPTQKMATAAIKFLFRRTLGRPEEVAQIPLPRIPQPLPVVLCQPELLRLFAAVPSLIYYFRISSRRAQVLAVCGRAPSPGAFCSRWPASPWRSGRQNVPAEGVAGPPRPSTGTF